MVPSQQEARKGDATRARIIEATFHVLMERGYAGASTREIARRAKVSKRELYALFVSKDGILAAMIAGRATRMRQPLGLPEVTDRGALAETLTRFGTSLLTEGSKREVMALFRLAIAETERAPGLARRLDADGRQPTRNALVEFLTRAAARGLIDTAEFEAMASQFFALLWADLQMALLLRLTEAPSPAEIARRAQAVVTAILSLYPQPLSRAS
jgi:AcrR family transcriptional regulator